ncbi:MAG TPA: ABC transporter permease [Bauldia sp.]|nr:ABC transporter permease [Bauldia sp.]
MLNPASPDARGPVASRILLPTLGALSLLAFWQFAIPWFGVPKYIVPTPWQVLQRMAADPLLLWQNFVPTLIESVLGFVFGNLAAILLAVAFVYSKPLERAYFPVVLFLNTIPVLAIAPVIILIFGIGILPKVVIASIICFFPTLVNMTRGLEAVTPNERELMHVLSASPFEIFWKLRAPRSLPFLFASLRISSTACVVGAIVGEWIGANRGLGSVIIQSTFNYRSDLLYAAIILSSSLAVAIFTVVTVVERRVIRYQ